MSKENAQVFDSLVQINTQSHEVCYIISENLAILHIAPRNISHGIKYCIIIAGKFRGRKLEISEDAENEDFTEKTFADSCYRPTHICECMRYS